VPSKPHLIVPPREALVSVVICTHNRAAGLARTLESLKMCRIPSGWSAEVIVVDNASTDDTAGMLRNNTPKNAVLRYAYEPKQGLSNARNAGLANARGEIILFTDDDVLVAEDWVEQMVFPMVNGKCDAVTGQVTLAPHLIRPWMTPMHKVWLASSSDAELHEGKKELIGANMGFRRSVLERVPAFDPELGAGALGAAEETLFGWQLSQAGLRVECAPNARVVHHLDASRLQRNCWLDGARKRGRTQAYLAYHWEHRDLRTPRLEWLSYWTRLQLRRILQPPEPLECEGCPAWEMSYVLHMEKCRHFCLERRRPRNYSQRGLVKRSQKADCAGEPMPPTVNHV
jgi:GT2 family glycosyltransferase